MTTKKLFLNVLLTALALSFVGCGATNYGFLSADVREGYSNARNRLQNCNDILRTADATITAGHDFGKEFFKRDIDECLDSFYLSHTWAEISIEHSTSQRERIFLNSALNLFKRLIAAWNILQDCSEKNATPETLHLCIKKTPKLTFNNL